MDVNNLKYVVGQAETGKPAIIRFFSSVNEWSVADFNAEFLYLQDYVKPSKIVVMINSEGGSVLHGMSAYSIISACPIEVDCVIEGIAASMASIIWAAGDNRYMHDYSLLMIHNPFNSQDKCKGKDAKCGEPKSKCKDEDETASKCGDPKSKCKDEDESVSKCGDPESKCEDEDEEMSKCGDPKSKCKDEASSQCSKPKSKCKDEDEAVDQAVEAFRSQLEMIYIKRFGFSKEKVTEIMEGKGNADGTFFSAAEAVKAGFLPAENVIKTSKKMRDKVKSKLEGIADMVSICNIMSEVSVEVDENKLLDDINAIHNRKENLQIQDNNKMEHNEKLNFDAISAQLGLAKDTQAAAIEARIAELIKAETTLKETQSELTATKIKLEGKEAELTNVNSELVEVKASLQAYKDAEQAARDAEIVSVVDNAIEAGKIDASAKEAWVTMAKSDFDTVKATLASIQAREVITQVIASDPENVAKVEETLNDVEARIKEQVKAKFGDIKFEKF